VLEEPLARAVQEAAAEVAEGRWDEHFPVDVFQTGSGTSSNMNANEVLATPRHREARQPGPPERPRQRLAVEQRRLPELDPHRGDERGRHDLVPALEHLARRWSASATSGRPW
jgi:fumarate hydratase class II